MSDNNSLTNLAASNCAFKRFTTSDYHVMPNESELNKMSDLCIEAVYAVMQSGSDEMKVAMRVVLAVLGRELAQRFPKPIAIPTESVSVAHRAFA